MKSALFLCFAFMTIMGVHAVDQKAEMTLRQRIRSQLAKKPKPKPHVVTACNGDYVLDLSTYPSWGSITPPISSDTICLTVVGSLTIKGCPVASCASNFPGQLGQITAVSGDLIISSNMYTAALTGATDLSWLPQTLNSVGTLQVLCNDNLQTLNGLGPIQSAGSITVYNNDALTTFDGINSTVSANLLILARNNIVSALGSTGGIGKLTGLYIDNPTTNNFPSISPFIGNSVLWAQVYRVYADDTLTVMDDICQKTVLTFQGGYQCGQHGPNFVPPKSCGI